MKSIALLLILLPFATALAQSYDPLVEQGKSWSNLYHSASGGPPPYITTTTFVKLADDTLLNNLSYCKVYACFDSLQISYTLTGFLREDTTRKVFYKPLLDTAEYLYYDFGTTVGDTVKQWYTDLLVVSVDSVYLHDRYRQRWTMTEPGGGIQETWIAGVGSLCGILWSGTAGWVGGQFELLCFFENNQQLYQHPSLPGCYYLVSGRTELTTHSPALEIFPNPVSGTSVFRLGGTPEKGAVVEIFSFYGHKCKTLSFNAQHQALVNAGDFVPGLYLYRLIAGHESHVTGKFIVQ